MTINAANLTEQTIEDIFTDFFMRQYHAVWGVQTGFRATDCLDTVVTEEGCGSEFMEMTMETDRVGPGLWLW